MELRPIFLISLMLWSSFPEMQAFCDWVGCACDCECNCPDCHCQNFECPTLSCPKPVCPECNCPALPEDPYGIKNYEQQTNKYMKNLEKEVLDLNFNTNNQIQNITLNNRNMHDETKETLAMLIRLNEELHHKMWKTADVMAIVIPLLILVVMLIGIIIFLLKTMFYSTEKYTKRPTKGNKNIPEQGIPDENASSVSSASEMDSDFEKDPQLDLDGESKPLAEEHHTPGTNGRRDEWTFNLAYFTRRSGGSIRSKVSNIYDTIRSIGSSSQSSIRSKVSNIYDYIRSSFRRSPTKSYLQNAKSATEAQCLLDSDGEDKTENDNPAFEEEQMNSDYPRAMMTQVTDAPYNFTTFEMYNETAQDSDNKGDPCDKTRELMEDCHSVPKKIRANSLEDGWQEIQGKDYGNFPSTSESPTGPSNTPNDDSHSLIILKKSSDADTSADKSAHEINERVSTEENSEDESASKNWFSVQSKDYLDTGMKSVAPETNDYGVDESSGTTHGPDSFSLLTVPTPSILLPADETLSNDTVSVNQCEPIDDGERLGNPNHLVTHGNDMKDFPLMNNESVNKNTTKDEVEGGNNTQLSKSSIGDELNDKHSANTSTTVGLPFNNFAESSSAELKLEEELDLFPKGTEEFEESFKPHVNDDIRITIEEENNEMQDNDTGNDSKEQFLSELFFETGPPSEQPPVFQSFDNNEHDLSPTDVADSSGIMKSQEKKLDQSDDQNTKDPVQSTVSVTDGTDDVDGEVNNTGNSLGFSGAHYEKLNKSDQNPSYAELFPPNMQDILKEMSNSAENILDFSRAEMKGSEPDDDNTGDGYDDDGSGYL